jgi:N-acyl-D-aspartate/D-glutamate deacylase
VITEAAINGATPSRGRRLDQTDTGYVATIVSGHVIAEHNVPNDARPGRLLRGRQPAPAGSRGRG